MSKLVRFVDAAKNEVVFINPAHVSLVITRSDGGAEIVLENKDFVFVADSPETVVKALDNG